MNKSFFNIIVLLLLFGSLSAYAGQLVGFGGVAQSLMDPVDFANDFVEAGCYIIGGSFVFASIVKYFEHRRSPLLVPISMVVFLLIAGIILILLPLLKYVTGVFN